MTAERKVEIHPESIQLSSSKEEGKKLSDITLPFIPIQIDIKDIRSNGKLLDDDEIATIKKKLTEDGRYSKAQTESKYGFIKLDGEYFAIYKGIKHGKELGLGAQGKVKLMQNVDTGAWMALKVRTESANKNTEKESKIQFDQEHKVLVSLGKAKRVTIERQKKGKPRKHHIIMNYERGRELYKLLLDRHEHEVKLPAGHSIDIIIQTLEQVHDLHKKGLLHRDIKLENLLYDVVNNKTKLIDHGLTKETELAKGERVGTHGYVAPEITDASKSKAVYNEKTEVYALGVTFKELLGFEIITDKVGFDLTGNNSGLIFTNKTIFMGNEEIKKFLDRMTNFDPMNRPTIAQTIRFFNEIKKDLLPVSPLTIGVLNLKEFQLSTDKAKFISALQSTDKVLLIEENSPDAKPISLNDKLLLRRTLEENGLNVIDKVLVDKNLQEIFRRVPAEIAQVGEVNNLFFATARLIKDKMHDELTKTGIQVLPITEDNKLHYSQEIISRLPVMDMHFKYLVNNLKTEIDRLEKNYKLLETSDKKLKNDDPKALAEDRKQTIMKVIADLDKMKNSNELSNSKLLVKLDDLQANIISTGKHSRLFGGMWKSKSFKGKEVIKKLRSNLEKESVKPFRSRR